MGAWTPPGFSTGVPSRLSAGVHAGQAGAAHSSCWALGQASVTNQLRLALRTWPENPVNSHLLRMSLCKMKMVRLLGCAYSHTHLGSPAGRCTPSADSRGKAPHGQKAGSRGWAWPGSAGWPQVCSCPLLCPYGQSAPAPRPPSPWFLLPRQFLGNGSPAPNTRPCLNTALSMRPSVEGTSLSSNNCPRECRSPTSCFFPRDPHQHLTVWCPYLLTGSLQESVSSSGRGPESTANSSRRVRRSQNPHPPSVACTRAIPLVQMRKQRRTQEEQAWDHTTGTP